MEKKKSSTNNWYLLLTLRQIEIDTGKELDLSVFEALTLMIAFATLVVLILGFEQKNNHLITFGEV